MPLFHLNEEDAFYSFFCIPLVIAGGFSAVLSIAAVFLFKNRPLQIRLGYVILFLHLLMCVLTGAHFYLDKGQQFSAFAVLPVISFVFQILAIRAVKKDEALIKSMDRLR